MATKDDLVSVIRTALKETGSTEAALAALDGFAIHAVPVDDLLYKIHANGYVAGKNEARIVARMIEERVSAENGMDADFISGVIDAWWGSFDLLGALDEGRAAQLEGGLLLAYNDLVLWRSNGLETLRTALTQAEQWFAVNPALDTITVHAAHPDDLPMAKKNDPVDLVAAESLFTIVRDGAGFRYVE